MARIFIGLVILVAVIAFLGIVIFGRSGAAPGVKAENAAKISNAIELDNDTSDEPKIAEYKVEEGDAWGKVIEEVGVDPELGAKLFQVSEGAHSLASIRTGNIFRFYFNPSFSELLKLEYDIDAQKILIIEKNGDGAFLARKEDIIYDTEVVRKSGAIESSLFETASNLGISPTVILNLATVFGWDIDFASSVQPQDSFIVAYEERSRDGTYVGPGKILAAKFTNAETDFYAFLHEDPDGTPRYYNMEGRELRRQFLRSPLDYTRITSGFSYNRFHPILNTFTTHRAIDYAASEGTPASVTADGTVTFVGWHGGNGKFIEVKHANGYRTGYAHLSAYGKGIMSGAKVRQNQVIGFVGSTGLSTGPHLHYEMRKDGVLINPLSVNLPPGKRLEGEKLEAFFKERDRLLSLIE